MKKVVIIGGGVIGILTALEFAESGVACEIVEACTLGGEASWAGGGIISPLYPWRYSKPVTALATWAQDYYPQLVDRIISETGSDPELYQTGLMMLDAEDHEEALAWGNTYQKELSEIPTRDIYEKVPNLAEGFSKGLWMPYIANIRNPRLIKSLRIWCENHPFITIKEQSPVQNLLTHAGRISQVLTDHEVIEGDAVVLAGGAWSSSVLAKLGITMPVEPVRGQMLLFHSQQPLVDTMVLYQGKYVIPRKDRHLLVGSTLEKVGFDKRTTDEALDQLLEAAYGILPELKTLTVKRQWAGLRPGSPNGIPFISKVPRMENLFVNAGHYRNGLVLAPASARLMVDIVLHRAPIIDPEPYRLNTFGIAD